MRSVLSIDLVTILVVSIVLSRFSAAERLNRAITEDEIFQNYKPIAMDESWKVVDTGIEHISSRGSRFRNSPNKFIYDEPSIYPDIDYSRLGSSSISAGPAEVEKVSDSEAYLDLPTTPTKELTKLITSGTNPTFVSHETVEPTVVKDPSSKVLANYNVLVPIFIPAARVKTPKVEPDSDIKFVEETVTEMVPVKSIVPHIKEVVEAERVPQKLTTHYVEANGKSVPSYVDDKIKSGERVISKVVTDYD